MRRGFVEIRVFMTRLLYVAVVASFLWSIGCATTADPPPPDLTSSQDSAQSRLHSIDAADASINRDLERLGELRNDLDYLVERTVENDVSLSLLRLVAMNCLNTEYDSVSTGISGFDTTSLSCEPAHFDKLEEALSQAPSAVREDALQLLFVVDQARLVRASLRQRLATLPRLVSEHRDFIVDERARLRQIEADLNQRRNLYSNQGWQEATDRIAEYRESLASLSLRLDEIVEAYPQWPTRVDELMATIYFDLSEMRQARNR